MVIFREYIQNAVDSIDEAVESQVLRIDEGKVVVEIDKQHNRIIIQDNGLGIPQSEVISDLLDIGNSKKIHSERRGFRGIGRLVGLSYSDRLSFVTSYPGETIAHRITFDGQRLRELLIPGEHDHFELDDVLKEVTTIDTFPEEKSTHYCKVILDNVENQEGILEKEKVANYISQTAPVPYSPIDFSFANQIHQFFIKSKLELKEYKIYIKDEISEEQLFKLNRDSFLANKQRKIWDSLKGIYIDKFISSNGKVLAVYWYGLTNRLGSILNDGIKGLRMRKGNILVGDKRTLDSVFKEGRFNGWFQGEIFVIDNNIIPNARRDDFELNQSYLELKKYLSELGEKLSKEIRELSLQRNSNKQSCEKTTIKNETISIQPDNLLSNTQSSTTTKYEIINMCEEYTNSEKILLEKVLDAINELPSEEEKKRVFSLIVSKLNLIE
jgi:hypothetical protein